MKRPELKIEPTKNTDTLVVHNDEQGKLANGEKSEKDNTATGTDPSNGESRARRRKRKKKKPRCQCECDPCKYLRKKICPYFPICCNLKLMTSVQILAVIDMYDPFIERIKGARSTNPFVSGAGAPPPSVKVTTPKYLDLFQESTTVLGPALFGSEVDADSEAIRYSKIAYLKRKFAQEVDRGCGSDYYVEHLFEHRLNVTRNLFYEVVKANYFVELLYVFNAVSILITTCCYFSYTSARTYLVVIWVLELVPIYFRLGLIIVSQSQRFCIFEYGLSRNGFKGLTVAFWLYLVPLIFYRPYKILVLSCFIYSLFTTAGNLQLRTKIEEMTLKQYVAMQEGYLRMDKDRDKSSSADEENETIM
ncbi:hypothetical protein Ocin01_12124 [Orchesella cincta]|uniref:Transmembrane protein n=1 Tax=Orchesella cincta TaxID=48709 RepID=A0A1D2MNB1_ORCCI|nr:hypothetical protein Ocin01_12124 [Orchesella cincta]